MTCHGIIVKWNSVCLWLWKCLIFNQIFCISVTYFFIFLWYCFGLVMAVSPAWHCASDLFSAYFSPRGYHCYSTRMYYALTTLCLLIWNPGLWFDKQLHGFITLRWWEGKILLTCWLQGFFFFPKWNLEMSSAALEHRRECASSHGRGQTEIFRHSLRENF